MRFNFPRVLICALALALSSLSCSEDSPTEPSPLPEPSTLPVIPLPDAPNTVLPAASEAVDVGLSAPIDVFRPQVARMRQMLDDGSRAWSDENRRLQLACEGGVLPEICCDATAESRSYVSASPRLLHQRYWRRLRQVTLDPGTSYQHEQTVSYGTSTSHTESRSFSQTIGVEVTAGGSWGAFSAEVKASYSATSTREEVDSVSFSTDMSFTDSYSVASDPTHTIVYALWQLVDVFVLVDEGKTAIDRSSTLLNVEIPPIAAIEFPSPDVIYQSVTKFSGS